MNQSKKKKTKSPFSSNIKHALKKRGISLRAAARMADIPYSTLHDWTVGGASPTDLEAISRLAHKLGVSFEFLCLGKEQEWPQLQFEDLVDEYNSEIEGIYKIKITKLIPKKQGEDE